MADDPVLAVRARKRIYDFVRGNPGFHLREVARATGLSLTLVDYHLRFLEKHDLVVSEMDGEYKRFFPRSAPGTATGPALSAEEKAVLGLLRQRVPLTVVSYLMEREEAPHKAILQEVDVAASTLSHHLQKLVEAAVVERTPEGAYRVAAPHRVARLMVDYDLATADQVDRFVELWGEFRA